MHLDMGADDSGGFSEEGALPLIGVDQVGLQTADDGQDKAGQAGPTPEVGDVPGLPGDDSRELAGIQKVPPPRIEERGRRHEIDPPLPAAQHVEIESEAGDRFT